MARLWVLAACSACVVDALRTSTKRTRSSKDPWLFAERFCFRGTDAASSWTSGAGGGGTLKWKVKSRGLWMLFYTAKDFRDYASMVESSYTEFTMQKRFDSASNRAWVGPNRTSNESHALVETSGSYEFARESATWFYVAFVNFDSECNVACERVSFDCNVEYALKCYGSTQAEWDLEFTNGGTRDGNGVVHTHFSFDEAGLLVVYTCFVVFLGALLVLAIGVSALLLAKDKFHGVTRFLLFSILLETLSVLLAFSHYAKFAHDGRGRRSLLHAARLLHLLADAVLLLLLVLLAHGWSVVRRKLAAAVRVRVAGYGVTYVWLILTAFVWDLRTRDPQTSVFFFDSGPGYLLVALRLAGGAWFHVTAHSTKATFTLKTGFYTCIIYVGCQWTMSLPFVLFVAALISDTQRLKTTMSLEPALLALTQLALLQIFVPFSQFNPYFPFHSTVTHTAPGAVTKEWGRADGIGGGGGSGAALRQRLGDAKEEEQGSARNFDSLSGGRGVGVNAAGKYVVEDGFEALHIQRLRHIQSALEKRVGTLAQLTRQLDATFDDCIELEVRTDLERAHRHLADARQRTGQFNPEEEKDLFATKRPALPLSHTPGRAQMLNDRDDAFFDDRDDRDRDDRDRDRDDDRDRDRDDDRDDDRDRDRDHDRDRDRRAPAASTESGGFEMVDRADERRAVAHNAADDDDDEHGDDASRRRSGDDRPTAPKSERRDFGGERGSRGIERYDDDPRPDGRDDRDHDRDDHDARPEYSPAHSPRAPQSHPDDRGRSRSPSEEHSPLRQDQPDSPRDTRRRDDDQGPAPSPEHDDS